MKKVLSVLLALAMVCALSVSVFAEEVVYSMTATQGQDTEAATLADGVPLTSTQGDNYCRLATNWVGGGSEWNALIAAVKTEGAVLRITYTGTLNNIVFQSETGSYEETKDFTVVEGDKNVATVDCATVVANCPVVMGGDFGGWANFMLDATDGTIYALEVVTGAEAPAPAPADETAEAPADTTAPVETAPSAETTTPADTGIVLAVLPMAMAAAAVVISKRK